MPVTIAALGREAPPSKMSEGYFRFLCPRCGEMRATVNPRNNLAHCGSDQQPPIERRKEQRHNAERQPKRRIRRRKHRRRHAPHANQCTNASADD